MPTAMVPDLVPALPEIFVAGAAMALLMLGVFHKEGAEADDAKCARLVSGLSVVVLALAALLVAGFAAKPGPAFGGMFVNDAFSVFWKLLALLGAALSIVISTDYLEREGMARFEYPVLIVLATLGMMMMISANDLIALYLGLELQSLALYVVAAFRRDDQRSSEAGLKYFVLGALASGMLLYGSSLVYGFSGATGFAPLAQLFADAEGGAPVGVIVGLVFILAGLAFKVSAVPFHMWTPDVYEGAPTPVTAFFAVAPKLAAMALFVRVMVGPFGELIGQWRQVVVVVSIASMLLGAFAAINQRNIKRLMAYSSIGNVGYALIGLAVGDAVGVRGVLIYMAIYMVMTAGTFGCILAMRRGGRMVEEIEDLAGLARTHPGLAFALATFMFSLSGIPPLAGFFGKLYVFLAAIEAELYALAVIGVLSSVVAAFYYLRIVKIAYFDEPKESLDHPVGRPLGWVVAAASAAIVLFFVFPTPLLDGAEAAAQALFGG